MSNCKCRVMSNVNKQYGLNGLFFLLLMVVSDFSHSAGIDRVQSFLEDILSTISGVSVIVVTIAVLWAGYKFLFKSASFQEVGLILLGGLLIGGAAEIASFMVSG